MTIANDFQCKSGGTRTAWHYAGNRIRPENPGPHNVPGIGLAGSGTVLNGSLKGASSGGAGVHASPASEGSRSVSAPLISAFPSGTTEPQLNPRDRIAANAYNMANDPGSTTARPGLDLSASSARLPWTPAAAAPRVNRARRDG